MAGMEALRLWMLKYISTHPNEFKEELKELAISDQTKKYPTELLKDLAISKQTGHYFVGDEVLDIFRDTPKPTLLKMWYNQNQSIPIDSLVLFNPALHPGELSYPVSELISAPTETLRLIPRKAVVYTTHDYANGALFGLRESILNAQLTQWSHPLLSNFNQEVLERTKDKEWYFQAPLLGVSKLGQATLGTLSLGYSFLYTQIGQAFYGTVNLPMDFWHHVQTGTLDGWFEQKSDSELSFTGFGKNLANGVDFFLPIKLTRMLGNPTQGLSLNSPLVFQRDEAEQGLFRLSRLGLGKTGLNHLAEGRWEQANLWGLADYYCDPSDKESCQKEGYSDEQLKNIDLKRQERSLSEFTPFAPNIDPETFCRFNAKLSLTAEGFNSDFVPEKLLWLREKFYSFDASKIYDSKIPPAGAHSDLRETKEPSADNCSNLSEECQHLEKRDYTFNFMLNFTKTDFEQELCELNPKEMQKSGVICSPKESGK